MERRGRLHHFVEVVSYIIYTVSIYYLSHFSIGKEPIIDDTYRIFVFCFMASTCAFFKGENIEIIKEMLKSGGILILCQAIDGFLLGNEMDYRTFIYIFITQIIWQLTSFIFAYFYNSNLQMHGKYTSRLLTICLSVLFILLFVFKLKPIICIALFTLTLFWVGYTYYIKNKIDMRQALREIEESKQIEAKKEQQKEKEKKKLINENSVLKEENKKLRAKLNLIETKKKRKRK